MCVCGGESVKEGLRNVRRKELLWKSFMFKALSFYCKVEHEVSRMNFSKLAPVLSGQHS